MITNRGEASRIRADCLRNAEGFVSVAERELGKGVDNVCFHLALLALEEVGKAVMVAGSAVASLTDLVRGHGPDAFEDHEKKLFWALWSKSLTKSIFSRQSIEQARDLSLTLHERRLASLYVDPSGVTDGRSVFREGEAETLVRLSRARLEMEKATEMVDEFNAEDIQLLTWFFRAIKDEDRARWIFSGDSLDKFETLGSGKGWMTWLKEFFDTEDARLRNLTAKELRRQRPEGAEAEIPKYRMTIRIQSQSHSVRNNAFATWNAGVKGIALRKSDRKKTRREVRSEIIMELTIPKAIHPAQLWGYGFDIANTFIIALNIATRGLFWWYVQKDIEKFYDEITDLEVDKTGNTKVKVELSPRLAIAWDEARLVLGDRDMPGVSLVYVFLLRGRDRFGSCLRTYAGALAMLSKIDVHFRIEVNAFQEFFRALKAAFLAAGDWDGKGDFREAARMAFRSLGDFSELDQAVEKGLALEPAPKKSDAITLTDVVTMKLYCDLYMQVQAKKYMDLVARADCQPA